MGSKGWNGVAAGNDGVKGMVRHNAGGSIVVHSNTFSPPPMNPSHGGIAWYLAVAHDENRELIVPPHPSPMSHLAFQAPLVACNDGSICPLTQPHVGKPFI
jgi:hypothetical protein